MMVQDLSMQSGTDKKILKDNIQKRCGDPEKMIKILADFYDATGYGEVDGLKGINCTHNFYPYWEGSSIIPEFHPSEPKEIDGKEYTMYEATQEQRKMERQIRELKRERQAQVDSGQPDSKVMDKVSTKLKEKTKEYKEFSAAAGLRAKPDRLKVD